jgi:hypothetical protein
LTLTAIPAAAATAVLGAIPAFAWPLAIVVDGTAVPTSQLANSSGCIIGGVASVSREVGGNVYFTVVPSAQGKRRLALEGDGDRGSKVDAVSGESTYLVGVT